MRFIAIMLTLLYSYPALGKEICFQKGKDTTVCYKIAKKVITKIKRDLNKRKKYRKKCVIIYNSYGKTCKKRYYRKKYVKQDSDITIDGSKNNIKFLIDVEH